MNPYMRFIDGGRRFQCSLCHHISEVPTTYFAHLDHTGIHFVNPHCGFYVLFLNFFQK